MLRIVAVVVATAASELIYSLLQIVDLHFVLELIVDGFARVGLFRGGGGRALSGQCRLYCCFDFLPEHWR